jgi:RNA polymerase sigma factor (sigma-70 family)
MRHAPLEQLLRHLRTLAATGNEGATDGQLLGRFAAEQDEGAFTAILRRHGAMVFGVCRRVLGDEHDAEDAFQQTFVVLARRAHSVRKPESLGNWLYGVAHRLASKARAARARRRVQERRAARPAAGLRTPAVPEDSRDFWPLLDDELGRLPEKYRATVVLCCLEGKTHEQAARELGWPPGSVSRRLARARQLLRDRLARRGVSLPATWLLAGAAAVAASVPAGLAASTVRVALLQGGAASAVGGGAIGGTLAAKVSLAGVAVLSVSLVAVGVGALLSRPPTDVLAQIDGSVPPGFAARTGTPAADDGHLAAGAPVVGGGRDEAGNGRAASGGRNREQAGKGKPGDDERAEDKQGGDRQKKSKGRKGEDDDDWEKESGRGRPAGVRGERTGQHEHQGGGEDGDTEKPAQPAVSSRGH